MNIESAFPSEYLKAADLSGSAVRVTMDRVEMATLGDDEKPILYFQGKDKGLVLNKTNGREIALVHGTETDAWKGRDIIIFPTRVDFRGKMTDAIRVDAAPPPVGGGEAEAPRAVVMPQVEEAPAEDVPF